MFNIINHSENENLNHNEIQTRKTIKKRIDNAKCWKRCGETEISVLCRQ